MFGRTPVSQSWNDCGSMNFLTLLWNCPVFCLWVMQANGSKAGTLLQLALAETEGGSSWPTGLFCTFFNYQTALSVDEGDLKGSDWTPPWPSRLNSSVFHSLFPYSHLISLLIVRLSKAPAHRKKLSPAVADVIALMCYNLFLYKLFMLQLTGFSLNRWTC